MKAARKPRRALAVHRVIVAAVLVILEVIAARLLGAFDPGGHLLAGNTSAALAVFILGAFFCLRFVVFFVVPPSLAVGLVALVLPDHEPTNAVRRTFRDLRDRWSRNGRVSRLG